MYTRLLYIGGEKHKYGNPKYDNEYNIVCMIDKIYSYYISHNPQDSL